MRNINRLAISFTVTSHAEYKQAVKKVFQPFVLRGKGLILLEVYMVEFIPGHVYFIKDEFFEFVQEPYLMQNKPTTKRSHYYAIQDRKTGLYWMISCSSRVDKYKRIIERQKKSGHAVTTIKIKKIAGRESALLLQDMFPISEKYVEPYYRGGHPVRIGNPKIIKELERASNQVIGMIRAGIQFTKYQPDAMRLERLLLEEES